ncbi:MAG: hypothetical protein CK604_05280 [Curvibacter sp. PD_MW3]|nr:MAG: hypothetical protein CK604_05280 [Curvibacter sp. PD_MW3]
MPIFKKTDDAFFWGAVISLFFFKLALVSDVYVIARFSPFDDSLYVSRAFALINDGAWGPYDAYVLAKFPGISFWLAGMHALKIPYLLGINVLYGLAGIYLISALRGSGLTYRSLALAYAIYLLNPVTFSVGWALVMREALSSVLLVILLGASLRVMSVPSRSLAWGLALALLSCSFAFSLLVREEDRLLWSYLALLALAWAGLHWRQVSPVTLLKVAFVVFVIPAVLAVGSGYAARGFNARHYGLPILSDYGEGEFPKLMATLRGIESSVDNRLVMLPQDVIVKLQPLVPEFAPVLRALPPPGNQTFSCKLQNVCSEWSNGWMPWWVKQASAEAGLTPTLPQTQAYFKRIREQIEALCADGHLNCQDKGLGMIPPMELRWSRAFLQEFTRLLGMLVFPSVELLTEDTQSVGAARSLVEMYQQVTLSDIPNPDGSAVNAARNWWPVASELLRWRGNLALCNAIVLVAVIVGASAALVWRWGMYPGVPVTPLFVLCVIFWAYSLARLLALAYVAVFIGPFESRMVFSTYTALSLLSLLAIAECVQAAKIFKLMESRNA